MGAKVILMIGLTLFGTWGSLAFHAFCGVTVYFFFAVLRPQFIWEYSLPPDIPWSQYVALCAMLGALVWRLGPVVAPKRHPHLRFPDLNIGHWSFAFFAFWITVTYYTALHPRVSQPFYDDYQKIFIMYFVSAFVITTVKQVWTLYLIVTLSLIYIGWEVNDYYFFKGAMFIYSRGYCGLDNNGAALMLAMGVPLCLFAWDGIRHWSRWGFLMGVPFLIHAVLTSYSRGAMLSLILSLPLYMIRCRRRGQLTIILLLIAMMVPIMAGKEIQERFFTISKSEGDESAQSRFTSWAIAWQMANERPIFGFGIRNSSLYTLAYGADMEGRVIHSQYLQIAADSGLVGLGAYLLALLGFWLCLGRVRSRVKNNLGVVQGLLYCFAFFTLRKWKRPELPGRDDPDAEKAYVMANGLEGAMIVFCLGSVFLSLETFELPYILLLMGAQLAAVFGAQESDNDPRLTGIG
jgi:probable O-glycosylation ligase (exosortase A-associated)